MPNFYVGHFLQIYFASLTYILKTIMIHYCIKIFVDSTLFLLVVNLIMYIPFVHPVVEKFEVLLPCFIKLPEAL